MKQFEVIIGLEVHVELKTRSKLFCGCSTEFGSDPNTHSCPVCLGMPGVLPVLNREAVVYATKAALALQCSVHTYSKFDRKQYFYPDLPKAYQISQYDQPLAEYGRVPMVIDGVVEKAARVRRIHLEEDAGKLNHLGQRLGDAKGSLVDLNRAGVPLIEIVSEPDMNSADEARLYLTELRNILSYLDISDLRMEEGSMRCDANVSLRPDGYVGSVEDLPRVEIKNVNSIRNVQRGIEYEILRQTELLQAGERIVKETRGFDDQKGRTYSQRSKEEANDYRYFPEPDLPPLILSDAFIQDVQDSLPPSTVALREELRTAGVQPKDVEVILSDPHALIFWRRATALFRDARMVTNWMLSDLSRLLNTHGHNFATAPISPRGLVDLLNLIKGGTLSGKMAKEVLDNMYETQKPAEVVVHELGLIQITDAEAIKKVVEETVALHKQVVEDYLSGKEKALGFLVGQVMKKTKGQAKPDVVNATLKDVIRDFADKT